MADMPTNDGCSVSSNAEVYENDNAEKFLTEMGMLIRVEDEEHFDLNFRSDFSIVGEIDTFSKITERNNKDETVNEFKIFDDFLEEDDFNPAETLQKQLEKDPLPSLQYEEDPNYNFSLANTQDIEVNLTGEDNSELKKPDHQLSQPTKSTVTKIENFTKNKDQAATNSKKKLTEFSYLLQRKGFRLMRKYYKEKFESFAEPYNYKKRVKSITPEEINEIILKFVQTEFSTILSQLTNDEFSNLLEKLKCVILSDRSNKREPMIDGIDFSVVKNLFGKYTQKTMKLFMKIPANSFLYTHFYLINGRSACYEQEDVDKDNFNAQMKKLMIEALRTLFPSVKPLYEKLYELNASYI